MNEHIKLFETHSDYEEYINSQDKILPNVSFCKDQEEIHYNPYIEPIIIAKYNVISTSSNTLLMYDTTNVSKMEIDGVVQQNVIGTYAFNTIGEHTVKITLSDPTIINFRAFINCTQLISIIMPSTIRTIGKESFIYCSELASVIIPDNSVTIIDEYAFQKCSNLTSITLPNSLTNINQSAFFNCGLTSVIIPNSVTRIGNTAFYGCSNLTSITIGSGVTSIGGSFQHCTNLENITSLAMTAPTIYSSTFYNVKSNGTLTVPKGSTGYNIWMGSGDYYLGKYNWTKIEQ